MHQIIVVVDAHSPKTRKPMEQNLFENYKYFLYTAFCSCMNTKKDDAFQNLVYTGILCLEQYMQGIPGSYISTCYDQRQGRTNKPTVSKTVTKIIFK